MSDLGSIEVGKRATVARIDGADEVSLRLMEMGLTAGVRVEVIGAAPLGDPIEIELRGYRLSLRRSEAARVAVETDE